jgi:hypothetical protein
LDFWKIVVTEKWKLKYPIYSVTFYGLNTEKIIYSINSTDKRVLIYGQKGTKPRTKGNKTTDKREQNHGQKGTTTLVKDAY